MKIISSNEEIGSIVNKWILSKGLKKNEIAQKLGINKSSLSQFLKGVAPLPMKRLFQIIDIVTPPESEVDRIVSKIKLRSLKKVSLLEVEIATAYKKQIETEIDNFETSERLNSAIDKLVHPDPKIKEFERPVIALYRILSEDRQKDFKRIIYTYFGQDVKDWCEKETKDKTEKQE